MFPWIPKWVFRRNRDTASAPTEDVELSDPPLHLAGEDEPKTISSFSKKEGKNIFLFVKMFFWCFFFVVENFLFMSLIIFPEELKCYLPKIQQCGNAAIKLVCGHPVTSINYFALQCTDNKPASQVDGHDCSRWSEDATLPWMSLGPSSWSDWEEMRPNWLGNRWKRKQPQ